MLEFKRQIRLEYLILIHRIDTNVAKAPGAECVIDLPGISVGEIEDYGISQQVPSSHSHAFHVHPNVEQVCVDQVRIERILVGVLPLSADLPIVLLL
jgi:hypothetical protein